jgi:hypothetical protein
MEDSLLMRIGDQDNIVIAVRIAHLSTRRRSEKLIAH